MAVLVLQILGLIMGLVGWVLESSSTGSNMWKIKSQIDSVTTSNRLYQGLWKECVATVPDSSVQCHGYRTVLGLPGHVQVCRALMIICLILGLCGGIVSLLGMKCIKMGHTSDQVKAKIATGGGVFFILSGLSSLIAVSWYASRVIQEFHNPLNRNMRFELGTGLYTGWGGASLSLLGGAFLCCSCRDSSTEAPNGYSYNYSMTSQKQKIYTSTPDPESESSKAYV